MTVYPWFERVWQQWHLSLKHNRLPLATLLVAKEGMGEDEFADLLAGSLLCSGEQKPCGLCHSCRLMDTKAHPDYHLVEPEKAGKQITVDQIRQINLKAQESSQFGGERVIIIRHADSLNLSAGNALLKTLEDSSGQCRFLLVTSKIDRMLPTVLSRCRKLVVPEPSHQTVSQWITQETGQDVHPFVLALNGYAPLETLAFIRRDQISEYQQLARTFCDFLCQTQQHTAPLITLLNQDPVQKLTWIWYLLADAQKYQFQIKGESFLSESAMIAQKVPYELLYQQYRELARILEQITLQSGLNSELLILDWLLKFDEVSCSSIPTVI